MVYETSQRCSNYAAVQGRIISFGGRDCRDHDLGTGPEQLSSKPPHQTHPTVEVHPKFSEPPHLRSCKNRPKTEFRGKKSASDDEKYHGLGKKTKIIEKNKRDLIDIWAKEPRQSETFFSKCATSIAERVTTESSLYSHVSSDVPIEYRTALKLVPPEHSAG